MQFRNFFLCCRALLTMDLLDHHVPKDTDTGLFTVDTFNDPHAALFKFKSSMYDLLLIDIRMPEMSGYDLYKEIRKIDAEIKVIFLTASEPFEDFQKVFPTFDMNYYVLKPVEITELIKKVNSIIATLFFTTSYLYY